jgi:hypothetical protein
VIYAMKKIQVYQEVEDPRCVLSFVSCLYMCSKVSGFSCSNVLCSFQVSVFCILSVQFCISFLMFE